MPEIKSIWSQLDGIVHLCQILPATGRLLKAICGANMLINYWLTSMIDGCPKFFVFPVLNSEIASRTDMRDILFWAVIASFPCPSCSVVYNTVKYGSPYHWLHKLWQALIWRSLIQSKGNSFSNYLSFFFLTLFSPFFFLFPQHWAVLLS